MFAMRDVGDRSDQNFCAVRKGMSLFARQNPVNVSRRVFEGLITLDWNACSEYRIVPRASLRLSDQLGARLTDELTKSVVDDHPRVVLVFHEDRVGNRIDHRIQKRIRVRGTAL